MITCTHHFHHFCLAAAPWCVLWLVHKVLQDLRYMWQLGCWTVHPPQDHVCLAG